MGRTKKAKPSIRASTVSSNKYTQSLARISSIASASQFVQDNPLFRTTQTTSEDKKKIYERFMKEEKLNEKVFIKMLDDDVDKFVSACAMLKLSTPSVFLNKSLKEFPIYRDMYAAEEINHESIESSNASSNLSKEDSSSSFKAPLVETIPIPIKRQTRRTSKLCTPRNRTIRTPSVITPKMDMNQPVSILRYARLGEQAVSMTGSPILMSSVPREDIAAVSVPFDDGRVLTIMPSDEFQADQMPALDITTKSQLHSLYKNLAVIFSDEDSMQ